MQRVMKDIFFKLLELCGDLPFLPERMKIEKVEQFVANLHDKTQYIIHIRNLKQALNHGLVLKKVHKMIKVNENVWLELYIDMNTDQEKKAKNDFEKDLFKLMNNSGFGKIMENMREDRHLICHNRKKGELFSIRNKLSYNKVFHRKSISNRNEKNRDTY